MGPSLLDSAQSPSSAAVTPIRPQVPSQVSILIIANIVSIKRGTGVLTEIMVITAGALGAGQAAESVTPIRAIGPHRVVPSFVCSHSPSPFIRQRQGRSGQTETGSAN